MYFYKSQCTKIKMYIGFKIAKEKEKNNVFENYQ